MKKSNNDSKNIPSINTTNMSGREVATSIVVVEEQPIKPIVVHKEQNIDNFLLLTITQSESGDQSREIPTDSFITKSQKLNYAAREVNQEK